MKININYLKKISVFILDCNNLYFMKEINTSVRYSIK